MSVRTLSTRDEVVAFIDLLLEEARDIDPGFKNVPRLARTPEDANLIRRHYVAYGLRQAAQMLGWDPDNDPWYSRSRGEKSA